MDFAVNMQGNRVVLTQTCLTCGGGSISSRSFMYFVRTALPELLPSTRLSSSQAGFSSTKDLSAEPATSLDIAAGVCEQAEYTRKILTLDILTTFRGPIIEGLCPSERNEMTSRISCFGMIEILRFTQNDKRKAITQRNCKRKEGYASDKTN